jgi:hypothetical protein
MCAVRLPNPNDRVRLTEGVPTLGLQRGDVGIVQSIWLTPSEFCEVEFDKPGESFAVRALVQAEHLEVVEVAAPVPTAATGGIP